MTTGRNDPCPCGSGKKYKRCCFLTSAPLAASYRVVVWINTDETLEVVAERLRLAIRPHALMLAIVGEERMATEEQWAVMRKAAPVIHLHGGEHDVRFLGRTMEIIALVLTAGSPNQIAAVAANAAPGPLQRMAVVALGVLEDAEADPLWASVRELQADESNEQSQN